MLLAKLVATSGAVSTTAARLRKVALIAELLAALELDEVRLGVAYLSGDLPQGRLGVGYRAAFGVKAEPAREASLTLRELDARFGELGGLKGAGSSARRSELMGNLFAQATLDEQEFLRRLLVGELRQGALEGIMQDAVAKAFGVRPELVRRQTMFEGNLGAVAEAARAHGESGFGLAKLELFRPVGPMLAQSAANVGDALTALGSAIFEHKLDGARVQIHKGDDEVRLYTRSLHEVTNRAPEIVEAVRRLPARSLILDGEVLSLDARGRPRPFQMTMRRFGRKLETEALRAELPLSAFLFDALHANGEDLIDRPARARAAALATLVPESMRVPSLTTSEPEVAQAFLDEALAAGQEGIMAKASEATYEAGRRGAAWLKVKPAHTLDLVVLAAELGSGRRRGFLSNIHLGARDPESGGFVMLGKTFKGMTDAMLAWQTEEFKKLELGREGHVVHLRPELVVEIAFDGVQASSQYPGGMALRFARVKRYRPDKTAIQADTIGAVRAFARSTL